jgi:hypothetical protein
LFEGTRALTLAASLLRIHTSSGRCEPGCSALCRIQHPYDFG